VQGLILRLYKYFLKIVGTLLYLANLTLNIFASLPYAVLGWPASLEPYWAVFELTYGLTDTLIPTG